MNGRIAIFGALLCLPSGVAFAQQGLQPASPQTVQGGRDPGARAMEQVAGMSALVRPEDKRKSETMLHAGPGMWTDTVMWSVDKNIRTKDHDDQKLEKK
jgi:hypothetical protein